MFAFYCAGIRVSDLLILKWNNIQNGRLIYQMFKTGIGMDQIIQQMNMVLQFYLEEHTVRTVSLGFFM
jgi:integrase